jgi:hypothetical protein
MDVTETGSLWRGRVSEQGGHLRRPHSCGWCGESSERKRTALRMLCIVIVRALGLRGAAHAKGVLSVVVMLRVCCMTFLG